MTPNDPLMSRLSALTTYDLDALRTARIREHSHSILARDRRRSRRSWTALARLYSSYLEPGLVFGFAGIILALAVERAVFVLL
jgi:hypothetical protein